MKFTFNGASDDLIEYSIDGTSDQKYTYARGPIMGQANLEAPDGSTLVVTVLLAHDVWHIAIGQHTEDDALPNWPITLRQAPHCEYATEAVIDAPDGTTLTWHIRD